MFADMEGLKRRQINEEAGLCAFMPAFIKYLFTEMKTLR